MSNSLSNPTQSQIQSHHNQVLLVPQILSVEMALVMGAALFAPALASSARLLHVSIDEIQWKAHRRSVHSVIEPGPWEFDIPLG